MNGVFSRGIDKVSAFSISVAGIGKRNYLPGRESKKVSRAWAFFRVRDA
jgi:hypothetical protein